MQIVYTTERPEFERELSIFLAGPTPELGSNTPSWRKEAIKILEERDFKGTVFYPESRTGKITWSDSEQIEWEHQYLNSATCILFWIPRDLKALPGFTTNIEFGLYLCSGKLVFGAPDAAPKTGYMRYCCEKFSIPEAVTLEKTVQATLDLLNKNKSLHIVSGLAFKFCPHCGRKLALRTEEEKIREYCQHCSWTHYPTESIAPAGIIAEDEKILLVQRNREPHKGKWQLPSGFKNYGETILEALRRELNEELGVKVMRIQFLTEYRSAEDPRNPGVEVLFYLVECEGNPVNSEPEENQAIGWFHFDELPPIAWKTHRLALSLFRVFSSFRRKETEKSNKRRNK